MGWPNSQQVDFCWPTGLLELRSEQFGLAVRNYTLSHVLLRKLFYTVKAL
jgi:hypothetical protein